MLRGAESVMEVERGGRAEGALLPLVIADFMPKIKRHVVLCRQGRVFVLSRLFVCDRCCLSSFSLYVFSISSIRCSSGALFFSA